MQRQKRDLRLVWARRALRFVCVCTAFVCVTESPWFPSRPNHFFPRSVARLMQRFECGAAPCSGRTHHLHATGYPVRRSKLRRCSSSGHHEAIHARANQTSYNGDRGHDTRRCLILADGCYECRINFAILTLPTHDAMHPISGTRPQFLPRACDSFGGSRQGIRAHLHRQPSRASDSPCN